MPAKRKEVKKVRQPHQRKPATKGHKSGKDCPEIYDELKKPMSLALTKTAILGLDELSAAMGLSRSEFIEQIGHKLLLLLLPQCLAPR